MKKWMASRWFPGHLEKRSALRTKRLTRERHPERLYPPEVISVVGIGAMTSMTLPDEVLKTDVLGRVRVKKARRDVLLDEFERGGTSAQAFAKMVGIKYQTFASWVQKRRRARKQYPPVVQGVAVRAHDGGSVAAGGGASPSPPCRRRPRALIVHLPGGARVEVRDARQAVLAAELLKALAPARPC